MSAEIFNHVTLSALFRYWDKKRDGRAMPARREIDPIEMGPRLLPHLMLCELMDRAERVRLRLVGTFLVKRLGFDPTGQWLGALPKSDYLDFLAQALRQTHAAGAPVYAESLFRWDVKGRLEARHLFLPLAAMPAMVLVGTAYTSAEVFPPQIRALDRIAKHTIVKHEVLPFVPAGWTETDSANVA